MNQNSFARRKIGERAFSGVFNFKNVAGNIFDAGVCVQILRQAVFYFDVAEFAVAKIKVKH